MSTHWCSPVRAVLDGGGPDALAAAERAALRVPTTKLNRPFSLINTYPAGQAT
jgi:hypothetical protein